MVHKQAQFQWFIAIYAPETRQNPYLCVYIAPELLAKMGNVHFDHQMTLLPGRWFQSDLVLRADGPSSTYFNSASVRPFLTPFPQSHIGFSYAAAGHCYDFARPSRPSPSSAPYTYMIDGPREPSARGYGRCLYTMSSTKRKHYDTENDSDAESDAKGKGDHSVFSVVLLNLFRICSRIREAGPVPVHACVSESD